MIKWGDPPGPPPRIGGYTEVALPQRVPGGHTEDKAHGFNPVVGWPLSRAFSLSGRDADPDRKVYIRVDHSESPGVIVRLFTDLPRVTREAVLAELASHMTIRGDT